MEEYAVNLRDFLRLANTNPGLLKENAAKLTVGCVVVCSTDGFENAEEAMELGQVLYIGNAKLPKKHPDGEGPVNVFVQSWQNTAKMPKSKKKLVGTFALAYTGN